MTDKFDNFEVVYEVYHSESGGFAGDTSMYVGVEDETDERINGKELIPFMDAPGRPVTIVKSNVAGWREVNPIVLE